MEIGNGKNTLTSFAPISEPWWGPTFTCQWISKVESLNSTAFEHFTWFHSEQDL